MPVEAARAGTGGRNSTPTPDADGGRTERDTSRESAVGRGAYEQRTSTGESRFFSTQEPANPPTSLTESAWDPELQESTQTAAGGRQ